MVQQELKDDDEEQTELDGVRILLVGDPGVGKTSLIYSLVNDEFEPNLPARMANITIPAEVTPENVPIHIVDYSEREQSQEDLIVAIREANVICVVYTAGNQDSLTRVSKHWISVVRGAKVNEETYKPIILVANKVDLLPSDRGPLDRVTEIIQEFVDIEAFIEVSALKQKNVVELFSSAQKAITYPLAPLFDPQMRVLTKKCQNALIDIFKQSDIDGDGLLNDHELNLFQETCFSTPLQKDALDDLKLIIKQSTIDGIVNDCMTQAGFLFLHALSIDKGRPDFTWQVLRRFNYHNQVNTIRKRETNQDLIDISSHKDSLSSILGDFENSLRFEQDASDDECSSQITRPDLSWLREHSRMIKTGLGLTLATLVSMLALRYIIRGSSRSSL